MSFLTQPEFFQLYPLSITMANYTEDGLDKLLKKDLISIILSQQKKLVEIMNGWMKFVS